MKNAFSPLFEKFAQAQEYTKTFAYTSKSCHAVLGKYRIQMQIQFASFSAPISAVYSLDHRCVNQTRCLMPFCTSLKVVMVSYLYVPRISVSFFNVDHLFLITHLQKVRSLPLLLYVSYCANTPITQPPSIGVPSDLVLVVKRKLSVTLTYFSLRIIKLLFLSKVFI